MGGFQPQGAGGSGTSPSDVDVIDRASRLLGIVYGNLNQLQQRANTLELLVQLRDAGIDIDPRQIRNLTFINDKVDISGSSVSILGSQGVIADQDSVTLALTSIDVGHEQIHEGDHYIASDLTTGLAASDVKYFLLRTPDTSTRIHLLIEVDSDPASIIRFFEDPTITADGTSITAVNSDRNSTNTAELDVFEDPTVTSDGTLLDISARSGGVTANLSTARNEQEWILKQNEEYLLKVTAISDSTAVTTAFRWYEES